MYRVNIIEDEVKLNNILKAYLESEGYIVQNFFDGKSAINSIDKSVDLWVIDIMLPDTNGYTVFKKIKAVDPNAKTIFISARNEDIDRVIGLEMGCDDYISKPFLPRELILRVKKILKSMNTDEEVVKIRNYEIFRNRHKVYYNGQEVEMSVKEYDLLLFFVDNRNRAFSREQILRNIWDKSYIGSTRVVDDTIRRIRKKLSDLNIETIYGYGYSFKD